MYLCIKQTLNNEHQVICVYTTQEFICCKMGDFCTLKGGKVVGLIFSVVRSTKGRLIFGLLKVSHSEIQKFVDNSSNDYCSYS